MPRRHVRIAPGGRVVIPAEYRKALGIKVGDHVVIELQDDELRVRSRRAAIRSCRPWSANTSRTRVARWLGS
jgi:AbrB family looped-hinge helix DNA binding protein